MAKQSALPLLLLAGLAAVASKKKKKKSGPAAKADVTVEIFTGDATDQGGLIPWDKAGKEPGGGGMETIAFDQTCSSMLDMAGQPIASSDVFKMVGPNYVAVNPLAFNNFITGKFQEGRMHGVEDVSTMTMLILQAMPGLVHCPWGEQTFVTESGLDPNPDMTNWTPLMRMLWEDLRAGVDEFGRQQGEWM